MDVSHFPRPQTVISSSIPLSSPAVSFHCHLPTSPRREFLSCGICIRPPDISFPRRNHRKLGLQTQSSAQLLIPAFTHRRFPVARSKKDASQCSSSNDTDILEGLAFSEQGDNTKQIHIDNQIEDPGNLFEETTMEERKHNFEAANEGHGLAIKETLLKSCSSSLKCEGTITAKIPQESAACEVVSCSSDNGCTQTAHESLALPPLMIEAPRSKKMRALFFLLCNTVFEKWRILCFWHGESSSSSGIGNPEVLKDKQTAIFSVPGSELYCSKVENGHRVPNSGKAVDGVSKIQGESWMVPWTAETVLQVMLLWIASFWFVGSWIIPFLANATGFGKEALTYRGQALYSLLTDLAEGLAGIAILHRCLARFRPLPPHWFRFSLRGNWQLDVGLGCLMFPLVNKLSQVNIDLLPLVTAPSVGASSVEQSIMARDPVAMALYAVVVSVCAPVWEEIIFRGFLLPSLTRYMPLWCSILVSAVAFAFAHFNAQRLLPLVFLGVVMGTVFARSKNLLASMLLHSLWNGFVFWDLMK
ncbi:hypothetical protein AAC387_Pa11g0379 [Persea americana]